MNRPEKIDPVKGGNTGEGGGDHFAAPLGSITSGRLELVRGASNITIYAEPTTANLYRACFEDLEPRVLTEGGTITIEYPRTFHPFDWRKRRAEVVLNSRIPWDIEIRKGTSRLTADLRGLELRSFEISGGASRVDLVLPAPSGTVPVRVLGGTSNLAIRRPEGVAANVRVDGGSTNLAFDEKRFGAVGGVVSLQRPGYENSSDRYDITITGGANSLTIDTR